jgi:hypothetical protein
VLLNVVTGELPLENVDAIFKEESFLGSLFGYGAVIVTSVGGIRLPIHYLRSPNHFYQILNKAVNRAKSPERPEPVGKMAHSSQSDDSRYMPKG